VGGLFLWRACLCWALQLLLLRTGLRTSCGVWWCLPWLRRRVCSPQVLDLDLATRDAADEDSSWCAAGAWRTWCVAQLGWAVLRRRWGAGSSAAWAREQAVRAPFMRQAGTAAGGVWGSIRSQASPPLLLRRWPQYRRLGRGGQCVGRDTHIHTAGQDADSRCCRARRHRSGWGSRAVSRPVATSKRSVPACGRSVGVQCGAAPGLGLGGRCLLRRPCARPHLCRQAGTCGGWLPLLGTRQGLVGRDLVWLLVRFVRRCCSTACLLACCALVRVCRLLRHAR
jgi:hypothetical protein